VPAGFSSPPHSCPSQSRFSLHSAIFLWIMSVLLWMRTLSDFESVKPSVSTLEEFSRVGLRGALCIAPLVRFDLMERLVGFEFVFGRAINKMPLSFDF